MKNNPIAFIFDMDGVVVDNIAIHRRVWKEFGRRHGKKITDQYFDHHINAKRGEEILRGLFGNTISKKQLQHWDAEHEIEYRKLYAPRIKPLAGLKKFLAASVRASIPLALATSAPTENVRFVFRHTGLKKYFDCVVDASGIKHGKPAPDIFLSAAKKLKIPPKNCVVFEDAILGVEAAKRAGMKVVGITTTYSRHKLPSAALYLKDFRGVTPEKIIMKVFSKVQNACR